MHANKLRLVAVSAAMILALVGGPVGFTKATKAASTFPGSIAVSSPVAPSFVHGLTRIRWSWKGGTNVKSTSLVDVSFTPDGIFWLPVESGTAIRSGSATWDTTTIPDGLYAVRVAVRGTTLK